MKLPDPPLQPQKQIYFAVTTLSWYFPTPRFCVKLLAMGSKDKGKKEAKKAPKPKPKPEPGRKREGFTPAPPK
ncbi:MAG: hypothetical protein ABSF53_25545 [Terracidiphilus sp.]